MRLLSFVFACLLVSSLGAQAQEQRSLSACGRINSLTPATATTDGSITIGTRTYVLRADALYSQMGQNQVALVARREVCLNGTLDASGAFLQYIGHGIPQPYCGRVQSLRAPTATTAGSLVIQDTGVATFPIPAGTDLSNDAPALAGSTYKCYALAVDPAGDALVTGRFIRTVDRVVTRFEICGSVIGYTPASASSPGSVRVGSRTFIIERGFVYEGDPAGDRADRTVVGTDVCLSGGLGAGGQLISFITQPFRDSACSTVGSYRPAANGAAGLLVLSVTSNPDYMRLIVPEGTQVGSIAPGAYVCLRYAVNADGDAFVTERFEPTPPSPGGISSTRPITQLPNTSTR
jgi:hypothetical protein